MKTLLISPTLHQNANRGVGRNANQLFYSFRTFLASTLSFSRCRTKFIIPFLQLRSLSCRRCKQPTVGLSRCRSGKNRAKTRPCSCNGRLPSELLVSTSRWTSRPTIFLAVDHGHLFLLPPGRSNRARNLKMRVKRASDGAQVMNPFERPHSLRLCLYMERRDSLVVLITRRPDNIQYVCRSECSSSVFRCPCRQWWLQIIMSVIRWSAGNIIGCCES